MVLLQEYVGNHLMNVTPYSRSDLRQVAPPSNDIVKFQLTHIRKTMSRILISAYYVDSWVSGPHATDDHNYLGLDMKF